ncbi:hypothetical protein SDC9_142451 [bioreactor metagenome]|uniref:Uncharacterized protein n=1 Tax=bioreactor metagenome TaxID=1076179 RepID=A0A645E0V0_9ZZZZ
MLTAIILFLFLTVIIYDYKTALKQAEKGIKRIYTVIMLISFLILILHNLKIPIPSPNILIIKAIDALFNVKG